MATGSAETKLEVNAGVVTAFDSWSLAPGRQFIICPNITSAKSLTVSVSKTKIWSRDTADNDILLFWIRLFLGDLSFIKTSKWIYCVCPSQILLSVIGEAVLMKTVNSFP